MNNIISRIHKKKDWSKVYVDRVTINNERALRDLERHQSEEEAANVINQNVASNFIINLLGKGEDAAQAAIQKMMCRHTLENIEPPKKPMLWKTSWGSQNICEYCNFPAITDTTYCKKCNCIAHDQCILNRQLSLDAYECPSCTESIESEVKFYNKMLSSLEEEKKIQKNARKIAKQLIVVIEKKRLVKKRKCVVKIQSIVRRYLCRKKYLHWLRGKMKIVVVKIAHIPATILENGVVVLTVFDTFKNSQNFRQDATAEQAMKQGFLIPGVTATLSFLFTIAVKDENFEGRRQYIMVGQAQLNVRDIATFTKKSTFDINFVEKIKWPPIETKGEYKYHLVFYTPGAMASLNLGGGSFSVSGNMSSSGGMSSSLKKTPSLKISPFVPNSDASTSSHLDSLPPINPSSNYGNPLAKAVLSKDRVCSIIYAPQNPVITAVAMVNGPPLDILKRAPETGMKKLKIGSSGANYRTSRYWLCLYRLKLMFFQYYGDLQPRLVSDVSEATAYVLLDNKGRKTPLVNVVHGDLRVWLLEFDTKEEACSFEFALNESKEAITEIGSIYALRSELTSPEYRFDFNMATIY